MTYIENYNVVDNHLFPLVGDYFADYVDDADKIVQLHDVACQYFNFVHIVKKKDLAIIDEWCAEQISTQMQPKFYEQQSYAYLIVIVGQVILKNKLSDYHWEVKQVYNDLYDSGCTPVEYYHHIRLRSESDTIDIMQAVREHLF